MPPHLLLLEVWRAEWLPRPELITKDSQLNPSLSCPSRYSASGRRYFAEPRWADLIMALPKVQEAGPCSWQWVTKMEALVLRPLLITLQNLFYWRIVDLQCCLVSAYVRWIWLYGYIFIFSSIVLSQVLNVVPCAGQWDLVVYPLHFMVCTCWPSLPSPSLLHPTPPWKSQACSLLDLFSN